MSNASAKSAARADRKMPNVPRHPRQKRGERTTGKGCLETSMPGKRANAQLTPVLAHIIECLDAIDVDQAGGTGEAKIHRRHETLSASKDLSFLTVRGEEIERVVNAAGRKISKRDGFHQPRRNGTPFINAQPRFGIYRDWRAETQTIYFDRIMFWNADPAGHPDWSVSWPPG